MPSRSAIHPLIALALASSIACFAIACGGEEPAAKPDPGKQTDEPTAGTGNEPSEPADPGNGEPEEPASEEPQAPDPEALAARGKAVYVANCIACHHTEPGLDGAIGPAVAGASADLLESRIMRAEYPEGYIPKRDTQLMIAMPYLESDLAALAAFLAPGS